MPSTSNAASRPNARPAPQPASSTAKAWKSAEKGGLHRSAWVRCGQIDQGQEASRSPRRYGGVVAARLGDIGRCAGSRQRTVGSCQTLFATPGSHFSKRLFADKRRLRRAGIPGRSRARHARPVNRKSSGVAIRPKALSFYHPALDRRAHNRLAQPLSPRTPPRTGKISTTTRSPSSASPPSASCSENSVIPHEVSGRTLSNGKPRAGGPRGFVRRVAGAGSDQSGRTTASSPPALAPGAGAAAGRGAGAGRGAAAV